ncbi:MAG TPA: polysaccharide biosynthesis tyrosine autokinase [Candidatus Limnocylindrales bacterium]
MDLRRALRVVGAWWPLVIASVIISAGVAYAVANAQPKAFEARTALIVGQSLSGVNPDYTQLLVSQRLSTTYATIADTKPILEKAIARVGAPETAADLAQRVTAVAAPDSALVTITVRDTDASRAAAIANGIADELIAASPALQGRGKELGAAVEQELAAVQAQITKTQTEADAIANRTGRTPADDARLETLQARLVTLRSTYASLLSFSSTSAANLLTVVEPATAPVDAVSPRPALTALLAAIVGLFLAVAIAFLADFLDDSVKTESEVQDVVGVPTLGTIERMRGGKRRELYRLAMAVYPRSSAAEAYRTLRTNVEFTSIDRPLRSLLVTSALASEGKTVTTANLAAAFAQKGTRVLLVDADLRRPGAHEIFGLPNVHGLTTLLRSDAAGIHAVARHTEVENLDVLTTGPLPPNPAELLGSQRMRALLADLISAYDLVILDSAPIQVVVDAAVLSPLVDGVILVVDSSRSRRGSLRQARETFARANAIVLGAVINGVKAGGSSDYYESARTPAAVPGRDDRAVTGPVPDSRSD